MSFDLESYLQWQKEQDNILKQHREQWDRLCATGAYKALKAQMSGRG